MTWRRLDPDGDRHSLTDDFAFADPGTGDGERAEPVEVGRPRSLARRQESAARSALRPRTGLVQVMPGDTSTAVCLWESDAKKKGHPEPWRLRCRLGDGLMCRPCLDAARPDTHAYLPSANPRTTACVRCGKPSIDEIHAHPKDAA